MGSDTSAVIAQLGFERDIEVLRAHIAAWVARCDDELRPTLEWQFQGSSKYFRPLTIFSCYRALYQGGIPPALIRSAVVLEMFHNVSLIIDDLLDRSEYRRGIPTVHAKFGMLPALMVAGYIVADGYRLVAEDPHDIGLLSELLKRLGVAECLQWRLRRHPLGVEDWRRIAGEDTGTMFEVCACLGGRTEELRHFGRLLGMLYHGCDDVGDVRGAQALGGGGEEDVRDGILTLPAAVAIQDPQVAAVFVNPDPTDDQLRLMLEAFTSALPVAEAHLDAIAKDAREEAELRSPNPQPLLALIEQTRQLSRR